MARWESGAPERLEQAALELFAERGYEKTTVADIAARAGLTERTFFRHFADKREALFRGGELLRETMVTAAVSAPATSAPMDVVGSALQAMAEMFQDRRRHALRRNDVVAASAELRERELIKMATLSEALAGALADRGIEPVTARLLAETGIAVFRTGFARWLAEADGRSLAEVLADSVAVLRASV